MLIPNHQANEACWLATISPTTALRGPAGLQTCHDDSQVRETVCLAAADDGPDVRQNALVQAVAVPRCEEAAVYTRRQRAAFLAVGVYLGVRYQPSLRYTASRT